jgi:hypothetical protein
MKAKVVLGYGLVFLVPCLVGGFVAHRFLAPTNFPRTYRATTVFQRNDTAPGARPEADHPDVAPFRFREFEIELKSAARLEAALEPVGVFVGMTGKRRRITVDQVKDALDVGAVPAEGNAVRVTLELAYRDTPDRVARMLAAIRDHYIYENSQGLMEARNRTLEKLKQRLEEKVQRKAMAADAHEEFRKRNAEALLPDHDPGSVRKRLTHLDDQLTKAQRAGEDVDQEKMREAGRLRDLLKVIPSTRQEEDRLRSDAEVHERTALLAKAEVDKAESDLQTIRHGTDQLFTVVEDVRVPTEPDVVAKLTPGALVGVAGLLSGLVAVLVALLLGLWRAE